MQGENRLAMIAEQLMDALNARGVGEEFLRTLFNQAAKNGLDPAEYLEVAYEIITKLPHPRRIGVSRWRTEVMVHLKMFREFGERPGKPPEEEERKPRPNIQTECAHCSGTGWLYVERNGFVGVVRCHCRKVQ
jgi:hypothetical protein